MLPIVMVHFNPVLLHSEGTVLKGQFPVLNFNCKTSLLSETINMLAYLQKNIIYGDVIFPLLF